MVQRGSLTSCDRIMGTVPRELALGMHSVGYYSHQGQSRGKDWYLSGVVQRKHSRESDFSH